MEHAEAMLRELLDRAAIRDVLLRYARGVDRRDIEGDQWRIRRRVVKVEWERTEEIRHD